MNILSATILYIQDGYGAKFCVMCVCPNLNKEGDSAQQTLLYRRGVGNAPGSTAQPCSLGRLLLSLSHRGDTHAVFLMHHGWCPIFWQRQRARIAITGMKLGSMLHVPALAYAADHCAGAAIMLLLIHLLVLSFIL